MPTYEYRCKQCEHELEVQQSFSDDPLTECPSCNEPALKKKFSAVGISFKGSGFYKTDSRGSSSSSSSSGSSGSSGSSSTSSSGDSSSKDSSSTTASSSAPSAASTPAAAAS